MEALCFKCSRETNMSEAKRVKLSNGVEAINGICAVCGTRVFRMVGKTRVAGVPASCSVCGKEFEGEFNVNESGQVTRFLYERWDDDKVYCHRCFREKRPRRRVKSQAVIKRIEVERRIGEAKEELERLVVQLGSMSRSMIEVVGK